MNSGLISSPIKFFRVLRSFLHTSSYRDPFSNKFHSTTPVPIWQASNAGRQTLLQSTRDIYGYAKSTKIMAVSRIRFEPVFYAVYFSGPFNPRQRREERAISVLL